MSLALLWPHLLNATQNAAIATAPWRGKGDKINADQAAVTAIRNTLNQTPIDATIAIGEGERDQAPMLYIGEKLGQGNIPCDIAVDPLEGTTICAKNATGALSIIALAPTKTLLHAPDCYMDKIAARHKPPKNLLSLDQKPIDNMKNYAKYIDILPSELSICVLERERNQQIINDARTLNASLSLIEDGDIEGALGVIRKHNPHHLYMGIGGAPEGVLAGVGLAIDNGWMQARMIYKDETQRQRARTLGMTNPDALLDLTDLPRDQLCLVASGITDGRLLQGVRIDDESFFVHSLVITAHARHHITSQIDKNSHSSPS